MTRALIAARSRRLLRLLPSLRRAPDPAAPIKAWPTQPKPIKAGILAMVGPASSHLADPATRKEDVGNWAQLPCIDPAAITILHVVVSTES